MLEMVKYKKCQYNLLEIQQNGLNTYLFLKLGTINAGTRSLFGIRMQLDAFVNKATRYHCLHQSMETAPQREWIPLRLYALNIRDSLGLLYQLAHLGGREA